MTAPVTAAVCWLRTLGVGGALGIVYGFLRPLRPRLTTLSDLIFALATLWGWVYMVFGICGGDSRLSCTLALFAGAWAVDATIGKFMRPVFFLFWRGIGAVFRWIFRQIRKLFQSFLKFYILLLAMAKKWVTIGGTITKAGGANHGKRKARFQAGDPQDNPRHQSRAFGRRRIVRGGTGSPVQRHRSSAGSV
jgi:hypothetical protein